MEIEKKIEWLKPERVLKLTDSLKSQFGMNRLLIIGLGRNGVDCALNCKHLTEKRFGTDETKVRFIGIAEDKYLDNASFEGTVLSASEKIPVVPEDAIYKYLNNPGRLPQYALDWFDNGLKNYSPAAPVYGMTKRQCGRVALFHNIKNIIMTLGDALNAFNGSDKSLEVIVTGNMGDIFFGGMFIDIPYIVAKLFGTCSYPVKINCYMFAPDTAAMFESDQRELGNYYANTILTKQELDMFQCAKKPFSQKYTASFEVTSEKVPYNAVFIAQAEKNYRYTLSCAAEKILNRMEILFSKDDDAERIMSYNMLRPNDSHDFRYLTYGVTVGEIPLGKIVSYLCIKVFTLINHSLNKNNVGQRLLGHYAELVTPDERYLAQKAGDLPALEFDERINPVFSARSLKSSSDGANDYIDKWLDRIDGSTKRGAQICTEEIYNSVIKVCEEAMSDFSKGPFYAEELVKKCLSALRVAIVKVNSDVEDMKEQVERARNLERTAYMKIKTTPLFFGKAIEQYLFELREYANAACKVRTGATLIEFYQGLSDKFTDYLENTIGKATEAFANIAMNRKSIIEEFSADTSENSCVFDIFSLSEVTEKLDEMVKSVPDDLLSRAFVSSGILEVPGDDETALARAVVEIVLKCFGSKLSVPIGDFCGSFGIDNAITAAVDKCIETVHIHAAVKDDFAINRVICPKATKQDDITVLRAAYKGMNYIWNGSVMNLTACVSQIKADVELDKFPDYEQWQNMHYAYVNDSLKKHGIHIFR
ncbi:MAG: tubulin-like doman-containing protein [Oscillospiraceae bacterium]